MNRSCFLSFAAFRTPSSPWDMRFPLCVGACVTVDVLPSAVPFPPQPPREGCPSPCSAGSTGSTARFDFSNTMHVTHCGFMAFADRPSQTGEACWEISRFSCMLFSQRAGFFDYAGPDSHSRITRAAACASFPTAHHAVGILNINPLPEAQ